jgi:hypothetical protein
MNRIHILAATCFLSLFIGVASAQQGQAGQSSGTTNPPSQSSGASGTSGPSGQSSGATGSGQSSGATGSGQSSGATGSGQSSGATGAAGSSSSGASGTAGATAAPVAGKTTLGVTIVEMEAIVIGWSAKRDLLGKTVVNDKKEKIGKIDDVIISQSPDVKVPFASFAIIGAGGFLGIGKHDVAIPMEQLKLQDGQFVLPGATKDALKALPKFEYARK